MLRLNGIQDPLFLNSFQQGEEAAFDCLYREFFPALTYFADRILADPNAAKDVVQDAFVILWQRRSSLDHISEIKAYLYTTVRNQCLKHLEKHQRQNDCILPVPEESSIEEAIIASDTARELYQLINSLSPALYQIVRLYYLEGKSNHEIAAMLNIEPDTVIRQRLRAIMALRKIKISL